MLRIVIRKRQRRMKADLSAAHVAELGERIVLQIRKNTKHVRTPYITLTGVIAISCASSVCACYQQ
jgi:hypothetical protein